MLLRRYHADPPADVGKAADPDAKPGDELAKPDESPTDPVKPATTRKKAQD